MNQKQEMTDWELKECIEEYVWQYAKEHLLSMEKQQQYVQEIFCSLRKLDVLEELLRDDDVTEIMINGWNRIFYEKRGEIRRWDKTFSSKEKLEDVIQKIVAKNNRVVNERNPIADTRLEDGSRVNIVLSPIAIDGSCISIRKFPKQPIRMEQLLEYQSISEPVAAFLEQLVRAGYNIFISGGTGSGKTTFLNALSEFIPKTERIVTIEDSAELQLQGIQNLIRLETRNANVEGVEEIGIRDLIRTALRMRPDRVIVGECRGAEALDMLQAMNTGHDGSLSTGHANSCADILSRLETMVLMGMELPLKAVRGQIASGIDILVHVGRLRDGTRKLLEVTEIEGFDGTSIILNPIWKYEAVQKRERGCAEWKLVGELKNTQKWMAAGCESISLPSPLQPS